MTGHLPRFLLDAPVRVGDAVELRDDEAKHVRVRRLHAGAQVALFDGNGGSWVGELASLSRSTAVVKIIAVRPAREHESPLDLTLAVGVLTSDRIEWVIEKGTELGVTRFQPFDSTHTLARPSPRRRERWRLAAIGAAKQCGRSVVPAVAPPVDFAALLAQPAAVRLLLAEHGETVDLRRIAVATPSPMQLVIGAEGGFTRAELDAAHAAGARLIGLGPRILRAETAAVVAVALCQARWGDLHASASNADR